MHSRHAQAASLPNGRTTLAGRTVRNVARPHLIDRRRLEPALKQVGRHQRFTVSPAVTVRLLDVFNNLTTSSASVALTPSGPGGFTLGSTTNVAAVNGVATFSNLVLTTAGTYSPNELFS